MTIRRDPKYYDYEYCVWWSPADGEYLATCPAFPSLSVLDPDDAEAFRGIRQLVDVVLHDLRREGATDYPKPVGW